MKYREVTDLLKDETGIGQLYKIHEKYFASVDDWAEKFATGDLLDEYELANAMDKLTGCFTKFLTVANSIEACKKNVELDFCVEEFDKEGKLNVSATTTKARRATKRLREIRNDFINYSSACEKHIGTCQSRLKRLTVEKGAKKVDYTGQIPASMQDDDKQKSNTTSAKEW